MCSLQVLAVDVADRLHSLAPHGCQVGGGMIGHSHHCHVQLGHRAGIEQLIRRTARGEMGRQQATSDCLQPPAPIMQGTIHQRPFLCLQLEGEWEEVGSCCYDCIERG